MKKTATQPLIEADDYSYPVRFKSSDENGEIFLTPKEAAAYLRVQELSRQAARLWRRPEVPPLRQAEGPVPQTRP
jgi:hypothetical protein